MNIAEHIAAAQAARAAKAAQLQDTLKKSMDEGRSMSEAEQVEFDELEAEISSLDEDLKRFHVAEKMAAKQATPVEAKTVKAASDSRGGVVTIQRKEEPGIAFAQFARCKLLSQKDREPIENVVRSLYPGHDRLMSIVKAPVEAANTLDEPWAGNLINEGSVFADFVEYLRPRSLLGQVQSRLRRLPFDTPVLVQTAGGSAAWVKEGDAKPVTKWGYSRVKMAPLTVAAISAVTKQQLMRSSVDADAFFRDELARAVGAAIDLTFIDPDVAPVTDESPGSVLNDVAPLDADTDTGIKGVRCDIATLMSALVTSNLSIAGSFMVMPETLAIQLSQMVNEIGNPAFPGMTPTGGTLSGIPVFTSQYAPTDSNGSVVALIKGDEIFFGDEGGLDVAMSDTASLVMDTAPSMNSVTPTASQVVSMFQTNSVAFRVERFLNWQRRRAEAVAWMRVNWSACEGS